MAEKKDAANKESESKTSEEVVKADEKRIAADSYTDNPGKNEKAVDAQLKAAEVRREAFDAETGGGTAKKNPKLAEQEAEEDRDAKRLEANPFGIETAKDEVANRQLRTEAAEGNTKLQAHAAKIMDKQPAPVKVQLGRNFRNSIYWERIDDETEITVTKDNPAVAPYITGRMSRAIAEGHLEVVGEA